METKLYSTDRLRIKSPNTESNFIDIGGAVWDLTLTVDMYPHMHYIELRRKGHTCRLFLFGKKSHKKEYEFGWWEDAEVIFALNEVDIKLI